VRGGLDKLAASLADTLASVAAKERFLHASVKGLATEYSEAAGSAEEVSTAYAAASGRVGTLTAELNAVSEALEEVRGTMDEKGSSMTDTSPLIRVKAALTALRAESRTFDLHIGVVGHAVLHSKVSHKVGGGAGPAGSAGGGGAKGRGGSFSKADVDVTGSGSDDDEDA
jgi:estrogen-related receptor beta like 1